MKILNVNVIPITVKHENLTEGGLSYAIVKIQTDENITGYGEICDSFGCTYAGLMREVVEQALGRFLIGEDPLETEFLVNKMRSWTRRRLGDSWIIIQAISGIEIALMDILGKARNQSISRILGAQRDKIDLYASGHFLEQGSAQWFMDLFKKPLDKGMKAVKVRIGKDYENDLITLRELRKEIGDQTKILIDGNENYTLTTAVRISKKLENLDVYYFEEPLPVYNINGMSKLKAASKVPIAYGEHTFNLHGFAELVTFNAVDILQPDPTISGGILECKKIGELALAHNLPVIPHFSCSPIGLAANLHVCACLPTFKMLEYSFMMSEYLCKILLNDEKLSLQHVDDGKLEVPKGPGLGIDVNESAFDKFPYIQPSIEKQLWPLSQGAI